MDNPSHLQSRSILKYRMMAALLATLMLVTSVGWVVDFHYCQGELQRFSLFSKAASCAEIAAANTPCHQAKNACHHSPKSEDHKGCCENESAFLALDVDFMATSLAQDWAKALPATPTPNLVAAHQFPFYLLEERHLPIPYLNYKPPLPDSDGILVLFQTFLC